MSIKISEQNFPEVTELVAQVKELIHQQFDYVKVKGEVTNLSRSSAGHYYFSLSDEKSLISSVLFRGDALRIPFVKSLKNGDIVDCIAELSVYEKRGNIQLIIKKLFSSGKEGAVQQAFEKTKLKLSALGCFDIEKKKEIPVFPGRVAIISAEGSAALQDFLNIYKRRSTQMDLIIVPSLVQGEAAVGNLLHSLEKITVFNQRNNDHKYDVVVICRGGGSMEDLWPFNNEDLAIKVSNFDIPVISAIGHQTDFTILDYVADLRAETPSAAAEILTEFQFRTSKEIESLKNKLITLIKEKRNLSHRKISQCDPRILKQSLLSMIIKYKNQFSRMQLLRRPEKYIRIYENMMDVDDLGNRLKVISKTNEKKRENRLDLVINLLEAYNPYNVLGRGYSIIKEKGVIASCLEYNKIEQGKLFSITFKDGDVDARKV